jgi:plasmid stabilization system protein ParE
LTVTYTDEAIADIVEAITYLYERNHTAAVHLDARIARCVERLARWEFDLSVSRLRSGALVRSWAVPPLRIYCQRHPTELLDIRVDRQMRRPITCRAEAGWGQSTCSVSLPTLWRSILQRWPPMAPRAPRTTKEFSR